MKSTLQRIDEIKRSGYKLDLGEVINDTFSNYKNIALLGGAVLLLVAIVSVVIFGGAAALIFGVGDFTQTITDYSEGLVSQTALIANFVGSVVIGGLLAPIIAGLIQMAHNSATNEEFDFGTAFVHYSSKHFKELFLGAAIIALVGTGLTTGVEFIKLNSEDTGIFVIGTVFASIVSALIQIFTILMIPLIIFGNLNAIDAIKGSFSLVSKNFWIILVLVIIIGIFIGLGILALCIGILFTYPAWFSMIYIIYTKAMPIEKVNELEEIGKNYF
jgi:hypothetical protein